MKRRKCETLFNKISGAVGGSAPGTLTQKQLEKVFDGPVHGRAQQVLATARTRLVSLVLGYH